VGGEQRFDLSGAGALADHGMVEQVQGAHAVASPTDTSLMYTLAALQLVVTLGWMAYAHFQPLLLERFGLVAFSAPLAFFLGLAGSTLAPITGSLGDRLAGRGGKRVLLVASGGLLAGATFVAVAATITARPDGSVRWVLLGLIVLWIVAMIVLQAPALALLPYTAPPSRLPIVASPLVMATVLPVALWPVIQPVLDGVGGPLIFMAGGVGVVIAMLALRRAARRPQIATATTAARTPQIVHTPLVLLVGAFAAGVVSAFVTHLAGQVVPAVLASRLGHDDTAPAFLSALSLGATTVFAPSLAPLGAAAGTRTAVLASLIVAALCGAAAPYCASVLSAGAVAVVVGAALALYLDCALPLAFELLPAAVAGLAAGLYLGGIFAGSQLANLATSFAPGL